MTIADLWRQVAETPEDLAVRLVLADALIDAGDSRGELIQLQCTGERFHDNGVHRARTFPGTLHALGAPYHLESDVFDRATELIAASWDRWLGDLARVLWRPGSSFFEGMLHTIHVGLPDTPDTLWDQVRGHRELCAVQRVRARHVSAAHYAAFVDGLAIAPESIDIHTHDVPDALALRRTSWPFRGLRYCMQDYDSDAEPRVERTFHRLAELCPHVESIVLLGWYGNTPLERFAPRLPALFPRLRSVERPRG